MTSLIELNDDYSEAIRYDRPDYPIYVRRGTLSHYPNYAAPSHWHDDVELIAVLDGEMDYNVNGDITTLHPGQGIFVNSRQIHFGFSGSRTECDFICVILHPLLRDTGLSVTEIALAVGFGGGSYYAKAFRDCCGKSPTQYRKEAAIPPPPPAASAPRPLQ